MDNDDILAIVEGTGMFLQWIHNQLSPTQIREAPVNISEITKGMAMVKNELVSRFESVPVELHVVES